MVGIGTDCNRDLKKQIADCMRCLTESPGKYPLPSQARKAYPLTEVSSNAQTYPITIDNASYPIQ